MSLLTTIVAPFSTAPDEHVGHRAGWLRAAVLGANDGIVSTSSLMVGVAAAGGSSAGGVITAGLAGLTAGALSMAAGEWVSVSSQVDVERADLALERRQLATDPAGELEELTRIYEERGISRHLAEDVARELSAGDVLAAHARDELGHHETTKARPVQASVASAGSFAVGGVLPLIALLIPGEGLARVVSIVGVTLVALIAAGLLGAKAAGAALLRPTVRVVLGGVAAMIVTALVGLMAGGVVA